MPSVNYAVSLSGGGVSINRSLSRTAESLVSLSVSLPVGKAGTLTTRTSDSVGEATLSTGHGITTAMVVDVFWTGGKRYGVVVGTVATNVVPISGGTGDNLPIATTALVLTQQVQVNAAIDGDAVAIMAVEASYTSPSSTAKAHVDFQDTGSASIEPIYLSANEPQIWDITGGATNVFTGNPITKGMAANGSSTEVCTLAILALVDATP